MGPSVKLGAVLGLMMALAGGSAMAGVMSPIAGDPIAIDAGKVAGTQVDGSVKAYFGLPFAAPPVRENRWRAPQPVASWSGIYNADTKRAECVQGLRSSNINHYFGEEAAAEDCLYLNLWAPTAAKAGDKLPVVVWIYGGGFTGGSASSPIYSGEFLARKGVIYVAANYRLGLFGFLAHPSLTAESGRQASGNWGFLDQVAALQWVQRNIAAFGGDPDNVTLVGQSAGSMSINNLQASPLAKGLFHRIFGMSGATVDGGPPELSGPLAAGEAEGVKLQAAAKAAGLDDLRAMSSDKISALAQQAGIRPRPILDGWFLTQSPQAVFEAGQQNDVPVATGSTANDIGTNLPIRNARTLDEYRATADRMYGDKAPQFLKLWPARSDAQVATAADAVGRNSGFALGARNWARLQARTGRQPAYLFMVSKSQPFAPGVRLADIDPAKAGAYHMVDVPYFLGTYEAFNLFRKTRNWTDLDRGLSETMQDLIVAYARTGSPVTPAARLVAYDSRNELRTDFGDTISVEKLNTKGMDFLMATPAAMPPRAPPTTPAGLPPSPSF